MKKPLVSTTDPNHRVILRPGSRPGQIIAQTLSYVEFDVQHTPEGAWVRPLRVYIDPSDAHKAEKLAERALRDKGIDDATIHKIAREFAETLEWVEEAHEFEQTI